MTTDTTRSHELRDAQPANTRPSAAGKGEAVAYAGDARQNLCGRMVADLVTANVQGQGDEQA